MLILPCPALERAQGERGRWESWGGEAEEREVRERKGGNERETAGRESVAVAGCLFCSVWPESVSSSRESARNDSANAANGFNISISRRASLLR